MNRTTIIMVVLALGSMGLAWSMRPVELPPVQFEDTGEALFAGFTDPTTATGLAVVAWDEKEAKVVRFEVEQKQGRWVIPSHNDYPADGTERMGKAAASFIDVKKDRYYGDNAADHAAFGVLDPEGAEGKGDEKGQRITIKDASGTVLVDIIVGKEIADRPGFHYVRLPAGDGSKRVYGSELKLDISTKFEDWIEKDLLKVERDEFVSMVYDPYTVDEIEGKIVDKQPIRAEAVDPAATSKRDWKASEGTVVPEGKELDSAKLRQMLTQMASLKIVGVRPRPEPRNVIEQQILAQDMQRKGFFIARNDSGQQQLVGNEGLLSAVTEDGVVFSLLFGEVTYESGISLSAGVEPSSTEPGAEGGDDEKGVMEEGVEPEGEGEGEGDTNKQASRFIFVDVSYDETLDRTLSGSASTTSEEGEGEGAEAGEEPVDDAAKEADEKKKLKGKERAAKLRERFDKWFYVISDSSYKQIHKTREELWKDAAVPKDDPAGDIGAGLGMDPAGMGGFQLPGG